MPNTGRLGSIVFKKETTWGTYVSGDVQLRASTESMNRAVEYAEDAALVGQLYTTDMIKVADGAAGSFEAAMHPDTIGIVLHGVLGGESAVTDPKQAYLIISYTGTSDYARLTKSTNTLTAELSSDGTSYSGDSNFGTSGDLDLSAAGNDTLTELQAVIAGYTGWDAVLCGDGSTASTDVPDFSATLLRSADEIVGAFLFAPTNTSATGAKTHTIYPAAATATLPSYSVTVNRTLGTNKSVGFVGTKFNSVTMTNAAKDLCKISIAATCKEEQEDKTDISLTVPDVQAYTTPKMKIVMVESDGSLTEFTEARDFSLTINANIDATNVIGSYNIVEQIRQNATMEISMTANTSSTTYAPRSNFTAGTHVGLFIFWQGNEETSDGDDYSVMCRIPDIQLTDYNSPLSTPDRLTLSITGTIVKPKNTVYTNHIQFFVVDSDTTTY